MKLGLGLALALSLAACGKDGPAVKPAAAPVKTTGATATEIKAAQEAETAAALASQGPGMTTEGLHLSEGLVRACNLPRSEAATHFAFDSSALGDADREVLAALSKCLAGPLAGKSVLLTGRADPRGEPEYNMGLGESRSTAVKRYLVDLGVGEARIKASSRGEIDATGTDEEGWAKDRRVDIDAR